MSFCLNRFSGVCIEEENTDMMHVIRLYCPINTNHFNFGVKKMHFLRTM